MVAATAVQASSRSEEPPDTDQAALPFWSVMAFTAVLLFFSPDLCAGSRSVPAGASRHSDRRSCLMYRTDGHEGFNCRMEP
jgi:hypothetical protein